MSKSSDEYSHALAAPRERMLLGGTIFVEGQLFPLFIPYVVLSQLTKGWKTAFSGLLLVLPEVFMVAAISVMGKEGFDYLKGVFFKFLGKYAPPEAVSRLRYRIGLVMFAMPLVLGFLGPYVGHMISVYQSHAVDFGLAGDVLLIASLFVLGGDFWDKLRALFVHEAKVHFPTVTRP